MWQTRIDYLMVTASEIIESIKQLSGDEQSKVVEFAFSLRSHRKLSPRELSCLAGTLASEQTSSGRSVIREALEDGFYGSDADA